MKTLKLDLKKKVLLVKVPSDAYDISIGTHCIGVKTNQDLPKDSNGYYHVYSDVLFFGKIGREIKFLCKASELTEEIAMGLVESWESVWKDGTMVYENYKNGVPKYRTALDSFKSAVESKGYYWENPHGKTRPIFTDYSSLIAYKGDCKDWDEAEPLTFNLENTLIFEEL